MPPKSAPLTQAAIRRMIKDAAIAAERARYANAGNDARGSGSVRGQDAAPAIRECTFSEFMKCNPTAFYGTEGAVELQRWFEKTENVFEISECAEGKKVKFAVATLQGPALTWWNAKVKEYNIVAYTQRFNELALMCPRMVEPKRVKLDAYIWGLTNNIKGEVTSSKPANLNEAMHMVHKLMEHKSQARDERILEGKRHKVRFCKEKNVSTGANTQPILTCYDCGEQGHTRNRCPRKVKQEEVGEVRCRAYDITDAKLQGPNVVNGTFLLNNRYAFVLFGLGSDGSFVDTRFINHIFEIDLMLIELGTFNVIISMDWLVKHDAVIIYGEKVVRIPYRNKMLIVESDKGVSRLKVTSCIKASKCVKRGCHLFLAHVTKKKSKEKRLEDVTVIRDFPEVFPEELPVLPPPRQVEF
uniref:CCHC-type domain-containing protein n=1 Tax=Tanacetum cinerariifolium TaxID=118510 RepID=A0A699JDR6_TANCI|nr:hypothetical protein [Tanacetum cinerariifolium]